MVIIGAYAISLEVILYNPLKLQIRNLGLRLIDLLWLPQSNGAAELGA